MKKILLVLLLALLLPVSARANDNDVDISALVGSQNDFKELSKELGAAFSYKGTNPAAPLGIGFDIGLEITAVDINENSAFWQTAAPNAPDYVPVPKVHAIIGLPFGIDIGGVYAAVPKSDIRFYGGSIKYAILKGGVLPAVAIRGAFTQLNGINGLDLSTWSADVSASKKFLILTPYIGVGEVLVNSQPTVDGLSDEKFYTSKLFGGLKLSLLFLSVTAEAEFSDVNSYTLKLSGGF